MSTNLTLRDGHPVSIRENHTASIAGFPAEKIQLIKDMCAEDATDTELELFLYQCNRTGLDPLLKQIYFIKRARKVENDDGEWVTVKVPTIQTSIDGFRVLAERTQKYLGQDGPYWCGPDGKWRDVWLDPVNPPAAARVGIYKQGLSQAVYGVARLASYAPRNKSGKLIGQWAKMPDVMIAKVSETIAFRKAFPQDMSGIYTDAEMDQATMDTEPSHATERSPHSKPTESPPVFDSAPPTEKVETPPVEVPSHMDVSESELNTIIMTCGAQANAYFPRPMITRMTQVITLGDGHKSWNYTVKSQVARLLELLVRAGNQKMSADAVESRFMQVVEQHSEDDQSARSAYALQALDDACTAVAKEVG